MDLEHDDGPPCLAPRAVGSLRPTDEEIGKLTRQIHDRVRRYLQRQGKLDERAYPSLSCLTWRSTRR